MQSGACVLSSVRLDVGRCGEMWGDIPHLGAEIWGDMGRYGEMWGDIPHLGAGAVVVQLEVPRVEAA